MRAGRGECEQCRAPSASVPRLNEGRKGVDVETDLRLRYGNLEGLWARLRGPLLVIRKENDAVSHLAGPNGNLQDHWQDVIEACYQIEHQLDLVEAYADECRREMREHRKSQIDEEAR